MDAVETVTILFTDLVGSTGLESRVGPAVASRWRGEHFALLKAEIAQADGREIKNTGDGVMVAFAGAAAPGQRTYAGLNSARSDEHRGDQHDPMDRLVRPLLHSMRSGTGREQLHHTAVRHRDGASRIRACGSSRRPVGSCRPSGRRCW
jgi:class 3 adenylate cyclase